MTSPRLGGYTLAPGPEWTGPAATWPLRAVTRETEAGHLMVDKEHLERHGAPLVQVHLTCARDGQSVVCLIPDTSQPGYLTSLSQIQAGILGHLRQCHDAQVDTPA